MIVAVSVTTDANDIQQAEPAIAGIEANCGEKPKCLLTDNGYASRANVEALTQSQVEFIATWKDEQSRQAGAAASNGVDSAFAASVFVWDAGQKLFVCPAGKQLKQTGQGEAIWVALAYNVQVWTGLCWTGKAATA